jgi:hypothetical protein
MIGIYTLFTQYYIGADATLHVMCEELKLLWYPGIQIDNVVWRVALINGIWDGKGFEQVTKTMGAQSQQGCNACDFHGIYFGHAQKYPFYSRYTDANDTRRMRRPIGLRNHNSMYNAVTVDEPPPQNKKYEDYVRLGNEVLEGTITASSVGINGVWAFDALPYAKDIWKTKDIMHSANNTIKDSLHLLKPKHDDFTNRTQSDNVIKSCEEYRIFPFVYSENPTFPWIISAVHVKSHDSRIANVIGKLVIFVCTQCVS